MGVVYCTFGEKGGVGVLALLPPEPIAINGEKFSPFLFPNPGATGGELLFMPVDAVERVDMSVSSDVDLCFNGSYGSRNGEESDLKTRNQV